MGFYPPSLFESDAIPLGDPDRKDSTGEGFEPPWGFEAASALPMRRIYQVLPTRHKEIGCPLDP